MRQMALALPLFSVIACASSALAPAELRLGEDACAHCRMTVVSLTTAAQIVAPSEEPIVFDEIGCLRDYLASHDVAPGALVVVADHRTGRWVDARTAVFTQTTLQTPMASGLIAHADRASRDLDDLATGGTAVDAAAILHQAEAIR